MPLDKVEHILGQIGKRKIFDQQRITRRECHQQPSGGVFGNRLKFSQSFGAADPVKHQQALISVKAPLRVVPTIHLKDKGIVAPATAQIVIAQPAAQNVVAPAADQQIIAGQA